MQPEKGGHDQNAAVTILDAGRVHEGVKQQSSCVSKNCRFFPLIFLRASNPTG